jgi:hypothetical protein
MLHHKNCASPLTGNRALSLFNRRFNPLLLGIALWLVAAGAVAQKTDVVTLLNGDRFTCEIKELQRGLLRVTTDSVGTLYIEWLDIASVQSSKQFTVETASGILAFGALQTSGEGKGLGVTAEQRTVHLKQSAVVSITPLKDTFIARLDGSVALGFSFKKANTDVQLNFSASGKYQNREHTYNASLSALSSSQDDETPSERYVGSFSHRGYIKPKWTSFAQAQLEQNTELDLLLRELYQGGAVYDFASTNRQRLDSAAGLALNVERYFTADKENRTSWELFASAGYEFFKFNTPKADLTTRFTVFPSLTERGRVRTNLDLNSRWEIVKDLYWVITVYASSDNQPPESATETDAPDASGTDYGVITSLEWIF